MSNKGVKGNQKPNKEIEYQHTLVQIDEAIRTSPQNARLWERRARLHEEYGNLQQAFADLRQAVIIHPHDAALQISLGILCGKNNHLAMAIDYFSEAIRLSPANPDGYYNRSNAYFMTGDYPAAIADYTQLLAVSPHEVAIYGVRSLAYERTGDLPRAIEDTERFLQVAPTPEAVEKTLARLIKLRNQLNQQ